MNIIKIQDQLRSVPDDALVGYVQNPSGNVPTYLALSELHRRKEMRESFQANQPEQKSVAEDLVQEAQPQPGVMGLPAGQPMQEAMAPQPEMPTEQMAQGGLANLDVGNMYNEDSFASGGIVAFNDGGDVKHYKEGGESFFDKLRLGWASPDEMRAMQNTTSPNPFMGGMPPADRDPMTLQYERKALYDQLQDPNADKQSIYNRINEVDSKLKDPYGVGGYTPPKEEKPVAPKKEEGKKEAKPGVAPANPYDALLTKNKSISEFRDEYRSALGDDPASKRLSDRLAKMDASAAKMEEQAPWLALAKAGFEMANTRAEYGKGQSFAADVGRGAAAGLKDYADAKEALNKLEEKRFTIDNELAKQARAEQVAAVNYGVNSKQHIDEQNKSIQLAKIKDQTARELAAMENNTKLMAAMSKGAWDKKDFFKAYNEVAAGGVSPTYDKWKKDYIDNFGEKSVTTADFRNKSEALIKEIINSQSSTASTPTIDTSGVKFLSLE